MVDQRTVRDILDLPPRVAAFYQHVVDTLLAADVEFLLGGAFAFEVYTDIGGRTKDLDIFLRGADRDRALAALTASGDEAEVVAEHWLAKVHSGRETVDLITGAGNGIAVVDDAWFAHARPAEVLGTELRLIPPEEMIWSKGFIMERERFDGADVIHLIRVLGRTLDWRRLIDRFGEHWRVLLAHVVLFDQGFPADRERVPEWVRGELLARAVDPASPGPAPFDPDGRPITYATLLSRRQYLPDVERNGYVDGRIEPHGPLTADDVAHETKRMHAELDD